MKRTVQMARAGVPKEGSREAVTRGIGKPKREWTPGPVMDFHKSFSRRIAIARAQHAEAEARQAAATGTPA